MKKELSFAILGHNPSVSFAEVYQTLPENAKIVAFGRDAVVAETHALSAAAERLGGIQKSGELVRQGGGLCDARMLAEVLASHIQTGKKFHFGLSVYNMGGSTVSEKERKALGITIKKLLREGTHSVRFVESRHKNLSAADVEKNKLLQNGVELCLFLTSEGYFIGITKTVQPFEAYAERDHARPARDPRRGMLPPKLAKTMIMLSKAPVKGVVVDPFCGIGTVLQEALLLGYQAEGVDIDQDAVAASEKNLSWLGVHHSIPKWNVKQGDAQKLDAIIAPQSVDAMVTEMQLGPPLSGKESKQEIDRIEHKLSSIYIEALRAMYTVLKPGRRAVIAWPYFIGQKRFISTFSSLASLGWKFVPPYPGTYQNVFALSDRGTLLYGRKDQHVFREILILEK